MRSLWAIPLLLSTLLLTATHLARPPANLKPKIFVLGLSKTGTTSIGDALALLGYKRLGWKDIRSRHLTRYYDAFEDLPWPFVYREMAELYPDARFLLSVRQDDATWLGSMRRHLARGEWQPYGYFYGTTRVEGNEETVLRAYRNHTAEVRAYFRAQPQRYAELNIDRGDGNWDVLCRLADCPDGRVPSGPFPRSNTAAHWSSGAVVDRLHFLWSWTITRIEEFSSESVYRGGSAGVNALLLAVWRVVDVIEQACSELYFKTAVATAQPLKFV
ncbi:hypothetical protein Tdes44962_MAKER02089 [Teratosphaeria destructans]|uniref:Sulfotransferase family protein n=1 Tax=Teratosphaeria destructans TaxID=418781 RepID=A0A9W7SV94_9PEZI|nr:hypothetical protein Tdes44962_MAKER02089 [Teratosphaeria destructans]